MVPGTDFIGSLLIVGANILAVFMITYFTKRAENIANRRELIRLNKTIEDIKTQNATTLALANANLNLALKGIESFESEALKRYIAFHEACSYILNDVSDIDAETIEYRDQLNDYVQEHTILIKNSNRKLTTAKGNLDLFNDNALIQDIASKLFYACKLYNNKLHYNLTRIPIEQAVVNFDAKVLEEAKVKGNSREIEYNQLLYGENLKDLKLSRKIVIEYANGSDHQNAVILIKQFESFLRRMLKQEKLKMLNS